MMRHRTTALAMIAGLMLSAVPSAAAETPFPFKTYATELDFSLPETAAKFEKMVEEIGGQSFVYIDWHLKNAFASEVFDLLGESDAAEPDADLESLACEKLSNELTAGGGRVEFSGRPNPGNNHLLLLMTVRTTEYDPFAIARCEYSGASYSPRIRGFFYVTEYGIATANRYELRPVTVEAASVPADFF